MKSFAPFQKIMIGFTVWLKLWTLGRRVLFGWPDFKNKQCFRIVISSAVYPVLKNRILPGFWYPHVFWDWLLNPTRKHTREAFRRKTIFSKEKRPGYMCARFSDHNGGWIQKVGVQRVLYSSSGIWVVYCHSELFQCVAKVMRFRKSLMHL